LLGRITFAEAFGSFWAEHLPDYLEKTFSVEKIRSSLSKENNVFFLAFADGLPVGYAKLKKYSPYEKLADKSPAQLQKIYLLPDFIGQRIGEKLQNALFDEVIANRIKTLWLAVWDENPPGIRFYERHGFRKETKYYFEFQGKRADFEVMVKTFEV
jgi:ribosomal protein S18 acetylase RimI-like enzyme